MLNDTNAKESPWVFLHDREPDKTKSFWVWDGQLDRIVEGMKWFSDLKDWGSDSSGWSGDFAFWMYPVEDIESIGSPYSY